MKRSTAIYLVFALAWLLFFGMFLVAYANDERFFRTFALGGMSLISGYGLSWLLSDGSRRKDKTKKGCDRDA